MSDAKLMMPLFCNGMFNCGGRRIRAVHLYDVSDGAHRYRLWTKAGTPDIDYPRVESDRYLLYVEIHGYLAPLGMTEYFLTEHCGYLPAMRELYGGAEHRRTYFDSLQKSAIEEAVAIERTVIYHLGKESPRQADYIHGILNEHLMRYTASKENGGKTFPDYVGALMADELDHCIQLSKIYRSLKQQEDEMRQAQIAEQDRVYQQSVNTEKEKAVGAALQIIRSGGTLKNDTLCYYKDDGSFIETSLILYLMREYHIDVPLRTQGWIKERLASATVQEDFCGSVTYYRAKKSPCSQKFFGCMRDLILAVHNTKKEAA